ncbi:MAG: hypothetical protein HKN03_03630 [Acidimicrobiales bacterium]|nr:hypothetical protein [Acidimicrobiales bacterium]
MAIRLNRSEIDSPASEALAIENSAAQLCKAAENNDVLLREALAVFVAGADRGRIGARAAQSLRLAIRMSAAEQPPFQGVRLRGLKRRKSPNTVHTS